MGRHWVWMVELGFYLVVFSLLAVQTIFLTMLIRAGVNSLRVEVRNLDESIAEAIQSILERTNLEGVEAPNPLQLMLFELIKGQMDKRPQDVAVIESKSS